MDERRDRDLDANPESAAITGGVPAGADFGFAQWILLVAGAAAFISSFASLAAARRPGGGDDEPQAGVESV